MKYWLKNLYILWFGCFVAATSYTLVVPFLPLFLKEVNVTTGVEAWAGLMLSSSFLTSALLSPVWGSLADRYGRKVMVVRSGIGMGIVYMLQYFVTNPYQLLALRSANGLFSGFNPASSALIATNTPEENIGPCLGIIQTASAAGTIMGPVIGGIMAQMFGYRETFLLAGAILLAATLVVLVAVKEVAEHKPDARVHVLADLRIAASNRSLRMVLLTSAFVQSALTILQPVLSLQIAKLGQAETASLAAGAVYSAAGFATVLGAPLWARRGERIGYKTVLVIGLLGAGLFNIPQAFVRNIYTFGAFRFIVGLATSGVALSVNAIVAKSVGSEFRGRAFGILNSANQFGSMFGPMVGGLVGTAFGLEPTFAVAAGMLLAASFATSRFLPRDARVHSEITA
jgi:MFS family permease